jgi:type IV secretory pathway TrbL component
MVGAVLIATASLAVLALLVFTVSVIAFLIQTSRHKPSRGWAAAAGASLVLLLVFGGIGNAVRGGGDPSLSEEQASTKHKGFVPLSGGLRPSRWRSGRPCPA